MAKSNQMYCEEWARLRSVISEDMTHILNTAILSRFMSDEEIEHLWAQYREARLMTSEATLRSRMMAYNPTPEEVEVYFNIINGTLGLGKAVGVLGLRSRAALNARLAAIGAAIQRDPSLVR